MRRPQMYELGAPGRLLSARDYFAVFGMGAVFIGDGCFFLTYSFKNKNYTCDEYE